MDVVKKGLMWGIEASVPLPRSLRGMYTSEQKAKEALQEFHAEVRLKALKLSGKQGRDKARIRETYYQQTAS